MYLFRTAQEAVGGNSGPTEAPEAMVQAGEGTGGDGVSSASEDKVAAVKKVKAAPAEAPKLRAQLFGSGTILNEVVKAQGLLLKYGVEADVWSVTSYQQLYRDAMQTARHNLLHPGEEAQLSFVAQNLAGRGDVVVAASDYVKALPESIAQYVPLPMACLGTDGFGRSDGRGALRDFFEVDARYVALAAISELAKIGKMDWITVQAAMQDMSINADKLNPHVA